MDYQRLKAIINQCLNQKSCQERISRLSQQGIYIIPYKELKLESKIGSGGLGIVNAGKWKKKQVAIKIIQFSTENNSLETIQSNPRNIQLLEKQLMQIFDELGKIVAFKHPNFIKIIGISLDNEFCIVTELCPNGNLQSALVNHTLTQQNVFQMAYNIALSLSDLHQQNLIHKNLKTENILLDEKFNVKISDYGLSAEFQSLTNTPISINIGSGNLQNLSTLIFMPPEVFQEHPFLTQKMDA